VTPRQKICPQCGAAVVLARAPNGGWVPLEPWPAADGRYRVVVLGDLTILPGAAVSSSATRRYDPHAPTCVPARKAAPRGGRPTQLPLGGEA
jgi:hypothetical protein